MKRWYGEEWILTWWSWTCWWAPDRGSPAAQFWRGPRPAMCNKSNNKCQVSNCFKFCCCTESNQKKTHAKKYDACSAAWYLYATAFQLYTTNNFHAEHIIVLTNESHEKTLCLNQNFSLEITMKNCVRTKLNLNQMDLINEWNQVLDIAKSELKCYTYFSCLKSPPKYRYRTDGNLVIGVFALTFTNKTIFDLSSFPQKQ